MLNVIELKMPLKHKYTKIHKRIVLNQFSFVLFGVSVLLWQKRDKEIITISR